MSFVMLRGSVPVFWSQPGIRYRPPPKLDRSEILESVSKVSIENSVENRIERRIRIAQPNEQFDGVERQTLTRRSNNVESKERQPTDQEAQHQDRQRARQPNFTGHFVMMLMSENAEDFRVEKDHQQ